jgi:glutathionyl-hydroquinone reductase
MRKRVPAGNVYGVHPRFFQPLADLHGILDRVALACPWEDRVSIVRAIDLCLKVEIAAHLFANLRNHFQKKASPIPQRSAVFVFPVVDCGTQELSE